MGIRTVAVSVPPRHRLPREYFEELCSGGGGPAAVRELWKSELSRRILLLRAVAVAAEPNAQADSPVAAAGTSTQQGRTSRAAAGGDGLGPLPSAAAAWSALTAAESVARNQVRDLLLRPQVGNWAAFALRRYRGRTAPASTPLWLDLGAIHTVALLASATAGLPWSTRLPVREGRVTLPGLGIAEFPAFGRAGFAAAETLDGRITLRHHGRTIEVPAPGESAPDGWLGVRILHLEGSPSLTVALDDLDPFRNLAEPMGPAPVSDAEFATWQKLLGEAWSLLCRDHPSTAAAIAEGLTCIVPLPDDGWGIRSASTGEAFGSVLISHPSDAVELALSLVHEFQHTKLGGLIHLGALCEPADNASDWYYAPWRDDPRPLAGLIQGLYAYVGITDFWRRHGERAGGDDRRSAEFEYTYARLQVRRAITESLRSGRLTVWGETMVDRLYMTTTRWPSATGERAAVDAAVLLARFHEATWTARHAPEPRRSVVDALAEAYLADDPPPEVFSSRASDVIAERATGPDGLEYVGERERWSLAMSAFLRRRLQTPDTDVPARLRIRGIGTAESALVRGDVVAARTAFLARIAADPDDIDAWVGLGLSDPSCAALLSHPLLVQAVHRRLATHGAAPEPATLASWLSRPTPVRDPARPDTVRPINPSASAQ